MPELNLNFFKVSIAIYMYNICVHVAISGYVHE